MKKRLLSLTLFFTCGCLLLQHNCLPARETGSADPSHLFIEANDAYRQADYQTAIRQYEQIAAAGISNGEIFYNLGNAYLKSDKLGKALLNYFKAEMLIPRDGDLQSNLAYARGLTRDKIECRGLVPALMNFCFWYSKLNAAELATCFLIMNFVFWGVLTVRMFYKREIVTVIMYILIFFTILLGASTAVKLYNQYFSQRGIVTGTEIMVRSGNSINDTVLFKLHEGTEFSWQQENDGWVKILLCDGKKGWVQKQVVEKIVLTD